MKLRNKKTGEIWDIGKVLTCDYPSYETLKQLNEEWEDYKPKDPLIKDEKIRKAVRAWAEAIGEKDNLVVSKNLEYHDYCIYTGNLSNTALIDFGIDLHIKDGSYTIAELCGEEEE